MAVFAVGVVVVLAITGVWVQLGDLDDDTGLWVFAVVWFGPMPVWFWMHRAEQLGRLRRLGGVLFGGPAVWGMLLLMALGGWSSC